MAEKVDKEASTQCSEHQLHDCGHQRKHHGELDKLRVFRACELTDGCVC